jgi:hypothetical protein
MYGTAVGETPVVHETYTLVPSDGEAEDYFAASIAVDDGTMVVASMGDDDNGEGAGSAYVFTRNGTIIWTETTKLLPLDGEAGDTFGAEGAIAIDGDTMVIGAARDNDLGVHTGSVYVFVRDDSGTWLEQAKLVASDGGGFQYFGWSVDINDDVVIVGAWQAFDDRGVGTGAAYIFNRDTAGQWREKAKLLAADRSRGDHFGIAVALQDNIAIVGAEYGDGIAAGTGSAYVFVQDGGGTWVQEDELYASNGARYDRFGVAIAIDGDRAIVGAEYGDGIEQDSGAAYVFTRDSAGDWIEEHVLLNSEGEYAEKFGFTCALDGDIAVIGSHEDRDNGFDSGSAFLFVRDEDGYWNESAKLLPSDGAAYDHFGLSLAIEGVDVVVGAMTDDNTNGQRSGTVYVFDISDFVQSEIVPVIDIKPDDPDNVINPSSRGRFWVAILSAEDFDALRVDPASVRLGASGASSDRYRVRDSNYDGVADLLLRFRTPKVGIVCGDTSVELAGHTYDGVEIVGEDAVRTVGCKTPKPKKKGKKK